MFNIKKYTALEDQKLAESKMTKMNLFEKLQYCYIKRQIRKRTIDRKEFYLYSGFAAEKVILQLRNEGFECQYLFRLSGTLILWTNH